MPYSTMKTKTTTTPRVEPKPDINPLTGKPDWTRYNASIVGNVPLIGAPAHPVCLPGLEATQGPDARPPPYRPVSFGATREYKDDEDGWQTVTRTKRRKWRGVREDE